MKAEHISTLLLTGAISLAASPALANSSDAPQFSFACQIDDGVPTTVAKDAQSGATRPVFNWKQEVLANKTSSTPKELCDNVTAKLEGYSTQGYDLSQISFVGTSIPNTGLPAICATSSGGKDCSKILFTLKKESSIDSPNVAQEVVTALLNPALQDNKVVFNDRGVQSTSYQVNFWDLFNLSLAPKGLFK